MAHPSLQSHALRLLPDAPCGDDLAQSSAALERVRLLVPEVARRAGATLIECALAFVERYHGNVLQLEQEREVLSAALRQAWQREDVHAVVRLVRGLAPLFGRHCSLAEAEQTLLLGIEASQRAGDRLHAALFLNRLGGFLFAQGNYDEGRQRWAASLYSSEDDSTLLGLWEPLSSFAYIADMLGNYPAACHFFDALPPACEHADPDTFVVACFCRGLFARLMGYLELAREDFQRCLRLLSSPTSGASSWSRQLLTLVVQTELARAQGDYARSQASAETALALAQLISDPYTVAALLIDQGLFTYQQGRFADTCATLLRLREVEKQLALPHLGRCIRFLEQGLAGSFPAESSAWPVPQKPALPLPALGRHEALTEREREVLELVALGRSNQEIAWCLVITEGTVKKHLEHIYTRLGVHSRTAAVARGRALKLLKNTSFGE